MNLSSGILSTSKANTQMKGKNDMSDYYYISTGEQTKMYTLRHRWEETISTVDGPISFIRDNYVQNLSIDPDKAKAKAVILAGENNLYDQGELESLFEIRRRESDEIQRQREAIEAEYEREQKAREEKLIETIKTGRWPYGQFKGEEYHAANNSYIVYFLGLDSEGDNVLKALQASLAIQYPELANLPTPNDRYYGQEKKRETITATLTKSAYFEGYYGTTYIQTLVKDSGECLVYKGSNPPFNSSDVGIPKTFKATIKNHDEYKGQKQTFIQRISFN